ncbi:MAG: hypothetical protein JWR08_1518, partial [Enterovirga sp.]|nr:hypothetical protein [Enterovirga sp.]
AARPRRSPAMAAFTLAEMAQPVSADEPCGPDLDLAGDPEFAQFLARSEGIFPASFYTRDSDGVLHPFDRATIDFNAEFRALEPLLETTRDLRLLTIHARLSVLNRDLKSFATGMEVIATLLREHWDDVHPRGEEGDYTLRSAILQALDENPTVILPLQHVPIAEGRRSGSLTYRAVMIAYGEAKAREGEPALGRADVDRVFQETDLDDLKTTSARIRTIVDAGAAIQVTSIEKAGYEQAVTFEKLPDLAAKMLGVVDAAIAARDPTAPQALTGGPAPAAAGPGSAPHPGGGAAPAAATGRVASLKDAAEALGAVRSYFARFEPSNPGALLVQQAQALVGKSFADVIRALVPDYASQAKISIGTDKLFGLTLEQFAAIESFPAERYGTEFDEDSSSAGFGSDPDDAGSADADGENNAAEARQPLQATTRREAVALLEEVASFYRAAEPSSPIPLLAERARSLTERDFLTLLKDVLPELVQSRSE